MLGAEIHEVNPRRTTEPTELDSASQISLPLSDKNQGRLVAALRSSKTLLVFLFAYSTLLVAALILSLALIAAPVVILLARLRIAAALLVLSRLRRIARIVALLLALFVAILLSLLLITLRLPALLAGIAILVRHWDASTLEIDFSGMVSR